MSDLRPTLAAEVQAPAPLPESEVVELPFLKDASGEPVKVLVFPIDELEMIDLLGALPAGSAGAPSDDNGLSGVWAMMSPYVPKIIERSCEPKFSFAEPTPEGALPGVWLKKSECMALAMVAFRVSGWTGAAAAAASRFLAGRSAALAGSESPLRDGGLGVGEPVQVAALAVGVVPPAAADQPGAG